MNPALESYFGSDKNWHQEMNALRSLVLDCGLVEEFKWKQACYTFEGKNILIFGGFKEYCALNFFKGALLQDTEGILVQQTEHVQSGRQVRFTNVQEIIKLSPVLKNYIYEALEVEKAGIKVDFKQDQIALPAELLQKFEADPSFQEAFESLTPGRQKGYLLFFEGSKQAKTRDARIEKYKERIFDGKGIRDCVCGLSKRMPNCDGSHKYLDK